MINIVLFEPEIAPNTGNIIRLCANSGASLSIIKPMGFLLEEKSLRRAGLDYHEYTNIKTYENFDHFLSITKTHIYCFSTKASIRYDKVVYEESCNLVYGPETRGIPDDILQNDSFTNVKIPMKPHSRSINLSNAVAISLYEALRQNNFK